MARARVQNSKLNNASGSKGGSATSMADLMASVKPSLVTFKKGDIVKGIITKLTPQEVLVDIQAKTEAVVLEKDKKILRNLLSTLKVGEEVEVSILNPESDMGYAVVSLRRFLSNLSWKDLEKKQKDRTGIDVLVSEVTRGGLLVSTREGVSGFLPNSHTILISENGSILNSPSELFGKTLKVYLLELNRQAHKIIFSQKPVMDSPLFKKASALFKKDQKVHVTVANITPFGIFVSVPMAEKVEGIEALDGLIHISEISWDEEKAAHMQELFESGQKVGALVIGIDFDAKRLDLSIKRLTPDPFEDIVLAVDQKVSGVVTKVSLGGLTIRLDTIPGIPQDLQPLHATIRKEKIPPTVSYEVGSEIQATVTQIDRQKHRIFLAPVLQAKPIGYR